MICILSRDGRRFVHSVTVLLLSGAEVPPGAERVHMFARYDAFEKEGLLYMSIRHTQWSCPRSLCWVLALTHPLIDPSRKLCQIRCRQLHPLLPK